MVRGDFSWFRSERHERESLVPRNSMGLSTSSKGFLSQPAMPSGSPPALLDQPAVTGGVQKLYEEIVAHHPIGIPTGTEMAAIRPYLS